MKKRKKLRPVSKFLYTVAACLGVFFILLLGLQFFANTEETKTSNGIIAAAHDSIESNLKAAESGQNNPLSGMFAKAPEITNVAVFGFDGDGDRSDVIMVVSFNTTTESLSVISVPRDTYTVMPQDRRDILSGVGRWTPSAMKINAVTHYSGKDYAIPFAVKQLEELLDIKIVYYVCVDLAAFKFIVDEIGGVEFDVPQRMYYNDPAQGLHIDLKPGLQTLNGAQAEGLVRYRKADLTNPISKDYPQGDITRTAVQQDFLRAVLKKMTSKSSIIGNLPAFFTLVNDYIETNFTAADLTLYAKHLASFKTENIKSATLPGYDKLTSGVWYFYADKEKIAALVDELIKN